MARRATDDTAERLKDPKKRAQLRAEHREQVQSEYADLAEVIPLDPKMESDLIDLLTDQRMAHLDVFYANLLDSTRQSHDRFRQNDTAAESRSVQQIRDLLGDERFGHYLAYTDTLGERRQANYFNARLEPDDKLTTEQKTRLMTVLRTQLETSMQRRGANPNRMLPRTLPGSDAEREDFLRKRTITMNEEGFRELQEESLLLLEHLHDVLTAPQLEAFTQLEAEKIASQRKYVQQMRVSAGMSPEFDETQKPVTAQRSRVTGRVKLEIFLEVNGEPFKTEIVTENGTAAEPFEGPEGLWVQATPILFEDGFCNVELRFSEEILGQRRPIRGMTGMGMEAKQSVPLGSGRASTRISGSKSYAISTDARVSRVE